jgi:hypothetical protein
MPYANWGPIKARPYINVSHFGRELWNEFWTTDWKIANQKTRLNTFWYVVMKCLNPDGAIRQRTDVVGRKP